MFRTSVKSALIAIVLICVLLTASPAAAQEQTADELWQLGRQSAFEGKPVEAERFFRLALQRLEANEAADGQRVAETLAELVSVLISQQRTEEAEKLLRRALGIAGAETRVRLRQMSILLGNLGTLYQL